MISLSSFFARLGLLFFFTAQLVSGPLALAGEKGSQNNRHLDDFVDISHYVPGVIVDMRYASSVNFVGTPVDGYQRSTCLLTEPAAMALWEVQQQLAKEKLTLKVFDCYRPQRAVDHFVRWAENLQDTRTKKGHYPNVDKSQLFEKGYIAGRSGHSRGSTLDLTLVSLGGQYGVGELDMGTEFDFFDPLSHTDNPAVSELARKNRLLLKSVMEAHGFTNLPEEWWHYTLKDEPYPDTYFDFVVE